MPDIPAGVVGFLVVVVVVAVVVVVVDVDAVVVLGNTVGWAGTTGADVAFAGTGFAALAGVDLRGFTVLGIAVVVVVVVGFGVAGGAAVWGAGVCWVCGFGGGLLASSLPTCSTQTWHAPAEQGQATPGTHLHTQMCWHSSDRHFNDQNSTINKCSYPLLQQN